MIDWYQRHRYAVLFATLLGTLVAPLREVAGLRVGLLEVFVAASLVVASTGIGPRAGAPRTVFVLVTLVIGAWFLARDRLPDILGTTGTLLWLLMAAVAAFAAVRFALRATTVDAEHVAAALSAYLLAGLMFAVLYVLVDRAWPGAIVDSAAQGGSTLSLDAALYFSYVTLATLGYGDVLPRDSLARGLAVVEALGAQLYLTVTVARLVGLHVQNGPGPVRKPDDQG